MSYEIEWTSPALRELRKPDKPVARRVLAAVTKFGLNPRRSGTLALTGYPPGTMRLRIGDYRVVYVVRDDMVLVTVVRVARRREAYRNL
ncbi:MAG: type II toxin-antitoxin system RelE family toxin [Pseudonocardiaceae bacterium]